MYSTKHVFLPMEQVLDPVRMALATLIKWLIIIVTGLIYCIKLLMTFTLSSLNDPLENGES